MRKSRSTVSSSSSSSSSSSWRALIVIGILFFLFTYSLYFLVVYFFLSSLSSSNSPPPPSSSSKSRRDINHWNEGSNYLHKRTDNEEIEQIKYNELQQIEEVEKHFFFEIKDKKKELLLCDQRDLIEGLGDIIEEGEEENYNLHVLSNFDELKYYQLCIGMHEHRHSLNIQIIDGTCDLFFATTHLATSTSWDWKINHRLSKKILIHTYSSEFLILNDGSFFLTVVNYQENQHSKPDCHINIKISPYSNERLLHQLPSLRGGKVLLKRDLINLTQNKNFH